MQVQVLGLMRVGVDLRLFATPSALRAGGKAVNAGYSRPVRRSRGGSAKSLRGSGQRAYASDEYSIAKR